MLFLSFCVLPGSNSNTIYERWEKQLLIVLSFSKLNVCAKNCESLIIFSQVTAKNVGDPFLRHSVDLGGSKEPCIRWKST